MKKPLWVVGKFLAVADLTSLNDPTRPDGIAWELIGVFDDVLLAEAACEPDCFVGPAFLNESYGQLRTDWEGAYYPKADQQ